MSDTDLCDTALALLARLVSRGGRAKQTSAPAALVVEVPLALLVQARDLLEQVRDSEIATNEIRQASNRVW